MGIMKSLLIVVAAAAVIILGLCIYLYNRRLDKIAKGEARGTHTSVPEPKMTVLVAYLTLLLLIVCGTLINSQRITSQSENYIDDIMDLKAEISDLRREIEENATHFRRISYVTRNADFKEKMVDIVYTIELKEYSDDTAVTVNIDGTDVALEKYAPGLYSGSFRTDMFKVIDNAVVKITDDGRTVTEDADVFETEVFQNVIPQISVAYNNASTLIAGGNIRFEGGYLVEAEDPENIESIKVTYMAGSEDIKTVDITEDFRNGNTINCDKITTKDNTISFRFEVVTKSGLKLVDTHNVCHKDLPGYPDDHKAVYDPDGNKLWDSMTSE